MTTELQKVDPKQYGLEESKAAEITKGLTTIIAERDVLTKSYLDLIETEITPESIPVFKELRLKISKNRTQGLTPWHKQNKAYFLAGGNFVQAIYNKEVAENERMEEKLMEAEKHFENIEKQRIAKLESERFSEISKYSEVVPSGLGSMNDQIYETYLKGCIVAYDARIKAEQEAEAERLRLIEVEKENARLKAIEDERIRLENEKLKAEAELREKEIEAERKRQSDLLAKQKADAEEKARIEKERQDKILADIEAKAKIERDKAEAERKRLEDELRAKQESERKAKEELDRKESERIAAEKKAAKAPEKEKLTKMVDSITITIPELKEQSAIAAANVINAKFEQFKIWAKQQIESV